ncbi:MAG: AAA family ATPase, partial [Patulibacter sp.]
MSLFSIWPQFGFRENPYDNDRLPGDEVGHRLLVGRDKEVAAVQRAIASDGTHPCIEGPAGIGKTSMLAVAGYRMQLASVKAEAGTLYVPVQRFFQVGESQPDFEEEVFREVAQTLIDNADAFRRSALEVPDIEQLNRWLNSPQFSSGGAQLFGAGASLGSEPNSSDGFTKSGFPNAVRGELQKCFPTAGAGAVVCVLDNLELLQTSQRARETLEGLRNRVFDVPGIRWVLCGSRGIVSRARSERLSGFFAAPLELGPLSDEAAIEL